MSAIIIGIGLDNKFISPDVAFLARKESIGEQEIARLLGKGKALGQGPLPTFLRLAAAHCSSGHEIAQIIISGAQIVFIDNIYFHK